MGKIVIGIVLLILACPAAGRALQPEELLLVVNSRVAEGRELAEYYRTRRQVPADQLVEVTMSASEDCSRAEYQRQLALPLQRYLRANPHKNIRCLVLFYGLPLRVGPPARTEQQQRELKQLESLKQRYLQQLERGGLGSERVRERRAAVADLGRRIAEVKGGERGAAVDSELALVAAGPYPLEGWIGNPYFNGLRAPAGAAREQVLMVSRLDGPSPAVVRRMIDDSLYAETRGLRGTAYFDARWPYPQPGEQETAYRQYDASIHKAAETTQAISRLRVVTDRQERVFQAGEAPGAALYCGWYHLGSYVDAFEWRRGAVGYHIASSECVTLKAADNRGWCKSLLSDGVAATLGPVAEPYVQGFPPPELFFGYLLDGYYSLAESYFLSLPSLSWQMILVGDPLYLPFRTGSTGTVQ